MESWSGEAKYRAILAVAEAANAHLDLSALLDALANALAGLVPIDLIGVVPRGRDAPDDIGAYVRSKPRRADESENAYIDRVVDPTLRRLLTREMLESIDFFRREHSLLVVEDPATEKRIPVQGAVRMGVRAIVLVPLRTHEKLVAVLSFSRTTPRPFSPQEVQILEDISRPVANAIANAVAYEEIRRLRARVEDENVALKEEIAFDAATGGILGTAPALHEVLQRVACVAATDATVLITGETGTGKELVARAIHASSPRAQRALVKVNCAVLPEGLVASELFGHERGAFTGALERRRGRFEVASGGTIFLDEIGELPLPTQVALLRVLQEGEFERVGGSETLKTDARVVAATNRDLDDAVKDGRFRSDLLFRLNVFPIAVPPLRERREDIPIIADYYASYYARKIGKRIRGVSAAAMELLTAYAWPGNVRELQNLVERAVILARRDVLDVADFELPSRPAAPNTVSVDVEREQIEAALRASRGRVSGLDGAARALGLAPSTLESRIQRLGIDKHAFRRRNSE